MGIALLIAAGAVIAAGAGYLLAHRGVTISRTPALSAHTATAELSLKRPSSWRERPTPAALAAVLPSSVDLADTGPGRGSLVVGVTQTPDPQLLPAPWLKSAPMPQTITLGRAAYLRYENLRLPPPGGPETVYAASTTRGTLVGICLPRIPSAAFEALCERMLATARVTAAAWLPVGPIPGYGSAFAAIITRLNAARDLLAPRLAAAPNATAQARDAALLAAAHRTAAAALAKLNAGPAAAANLGVATTLNRLAAAYDALSRAAAHPAPVAYRSARVTLGRLMGELNIAFAQLRAFGYQLSRTA